MTPEISVVIPTWDRAHCVGDSIDSVLAQEGVSLECIVVDDGSTDDTVAVVSARADADARVRLLTGEHGGPSSARNTGIAAARGELVAFQDSDDLKAPGALAGLRDRRAELGADGVIGRWKAEPNSAVEAPDWMRLREEPDAGWSFISLLVDRTCLEAVGGFDPELRLGEDFDLLVRLREAGFTIEAVDVLVAMKRFHGDNLSYEIDNLGRSLGAVVRRHRRRTSTS